MGNRGAARAAPMTTVRPPLRKGDERVAASFQLVRVPLAPTGAGAPRRHLYRARADGARGMYTTHLLLDETERTVRPCDASGAPLGTLRLDLDAGEARGATPYHEPAFTATDFMQLSAHLGARFLKEGTPPAQLTKHFY